MAAEKVCNSALIRSIQPQLSAITVVVAGLKTEVCNNTFALSAMHDADYEIYMGADASGGTSKDAHDYAMQRMIQAGVVPVTWQQVLLEWQRDWFRRATGTSPSEWRRRFGNEPAWPPASIAPTTSATVSTPTPSAACESVLP